MSMGYCRLGLAVVAAFGLLILLIPASASAEGALAPARLGMMGAGAPLVSVHFRKTQSFYCYPKNYWWFYRPYTTALYGHPRCMPYFHYFGPGGPRGAKPDRYIK
jgi:hypothetical protein